MQQHQDQLDDNATTGADTTMPPTTFGKQTRQAVRFQLMTTTRNQNALKMCL